VQPPAFLTTVASLITLVAILVNYTAPSSEIAASLNTAPPAAATDSISLANSTIYLGIVECRFTYHRCFYYSPSPPPAAHINSAVSASVISSLVTFARIIASPTAAALIAAHSATTTSIVDLHSIVHSTTPAKHGMFFCSVASTVL
jgi:hypothetical protein